jgi:hypothetical protein
MKLTKEYVFGTKFRHQFKMLQSLAFVPPNDVIDAFIQLKMTVDDKLIPLFDYFEKSYICKIKRATKRNPIPSQRKNPLFPISIWNVHEKTLMNLPRTNNNLESWHNAIQSEAKKHSSIYRVIQFLRKEQEFTQFKLVKMSIGEFQDSNDKYNSLNNKLIVVINEYIENDKLDFLDKMALALTSSKQGNSNEHITSQRQFIKETYGVEEQEEGGED